MTDTLKIMPHAPTPEQEENLLKLAAYLEGLPENYQEFGMASFYRGEQEWEYARGEVGFGSCGTVACAVGHGPAAGIHFTDKEALVLRDGDFWVRWSVYGNRFADDEHVFMWLFAGNWARADDHHWGAAARIRFYLGNGGYPAQFSWELYNYEGMLPLYEPYRKKAA